MKGRSGTGVRTVQVCRSGIQGTSGLSANRCFVLGYRGQVSEGQVGGQHTGHRSVTVAGTRLLLRNTGNRLLLLGGKLGSRWVVGTLAFCCGTQVTGGRHTGLLLLDTVEVAF